MSDDEIMKLDSSMREVLLFIRHSKDNENLEKILKSDDRFKNLERRAADVIETITNSGLEYEPDEEVVDMCEAIQKIRMDSRLEGERIGEERGKLLGEKLGEERGEITAKKSAAENFYSMGMDIEKIAQGLREPVETIKDWLKATPYK